MEFSPAPHSVSGAHAALGGVRRLRQLADGAQDAEAILAGLARELIATVGAQEVHFHHPSALGDQDLVVVYVLGGDGRLSYLQPRQERPPGVGWVASSGRSFLAIGERELASALPGLNLGEGSGLEPGGNLGGGSGFKSGGNLGGGSGSRPGGNLGERYGYGTGSGEAAPPCALLAPLQVGGQVESVAVLTRHARAPFDEESIDLAATLIDQAATALALVRARAEAGTDPVVGCMNHRAMRRRLGEEIGRARRAGAPLSCLMVDLDDFKLINDRHGHHAGDAALREVARALMGEFRAFDRVARYGGDEFVVILPHADIESAASAGARALGRLKAVPTADRHGVGASIGAAQWREPMGVDELLQACDEALLQRKRHGKAGVTRAGGSPTMAVHV